MNTINIVQDHDNYRIQFRYDPTLVFLIKQVPGKMWNPENKYWTIPSDKLGFFLAQIKGTPYETQTQIYSDENIGQDEELPVTVDIPDVDVSDYKFRVMKGGQLYKHQIDFMKYAIARERSGKMSGFLLLDEMGCIAGNQQVWINEPGKPATRNVSLSRFYALWREDPAIKIKSLVHGRFHYCNVKNVIYKGVKPTVCIKTKSHSLTCTPDHEILTPNGWIEARNLNVSDVILVNGQAVCRGCGSSKNVILDPHAKFSGYCRSCMYKLRDGTKYKPQDGIIRKVDEDGYVRLKGYELRFHPLYNINGGEGIYEHWYVWYENTGHVVNSRIESIHHKNRNKTDNRFENLELLSIHDHAAKHLDDSCRNLPQYNTNYNYIQRSSAKVYYVPREETIVEINSSDDTDVYDVSIADEGVHNFIANGVIVHNCGKTLEALNLAIYNKQFLGIKHVLIVCCINTSKYNWMDDIKKHTQNEFEPYLLGTRLNKKGEPKSEFTSADKLEDLTTLKKYGTSEDDLPFFNIVNIEAIRMNSGRKYPIADKLIELINKGYFQMIFIDEIHKNMSPQSQQGKQIARIKKYTENRCMWIPLTGTPIVKKPLDLYLPLRLVDAHQYTSFWKWSQNFCIYGGFGGHEVIGYKNINQLKFMLQYNSIRRLKKDVLDLPPKIDYTEYVENTPYQKRIYNKLQNELKNNREECVKSLNPMSMFLRLRQVNGSPELIDESCRNLLNSENYKEYLKRNAKISKLLEILEDIHERGEKVVVFSNWVEPLRTIYKIISKKYKTCVYTGTMNEKERRHHKDVFINNPHYTVMLGTIGALGTSHTLTVARNAIFYDCPWNMTDYNQSSDRIYRVGTTQSAMIYKLITKDTVDERVDQIMFDKQGISGFIVDNIDIHSNPKLFDLLLSDTKRK